MPIEAASILAASRTRRAVRLALGLAIATAFAYGRGWTMPHLVVLLAAALLVPPAPPPGVRQVVPLLLVMTLACGWGLLLAVVLEHAPLVGLLMMIGGVALAGALACRPGMAVLGTLFIMGDTLIATVALQSSALAVSVIELMLVGTVAAVVIAHIVHLALPDSAQPAIASPVAPPLDAGWVGVRSALIMVPPVIMALSNPAAYIMVLLKGAQLAQQATATDTRRAARDLVGSTAAGGLGALLLWWLLGLWPGLFMLCVVFALAGILAGNKLYAPPGRFGFDWWQNALTTLIIILGPAVTDSAGADNIQLLILTRTLTYIALALYAAAMVHLLDSRRSRRVARPA